MAQSALQTDFFTQMAEPHILRAMFDQLPHVYFFVKDRESHLIAASRAIFARLGVKEEREIVGARDEDLFPEPIARGYRDDDQLIYQTGKPLLNRLEVWYDEQRNLEWCITTKIPLLGKDGSIIGLMGMTRPDESQAQLPPESAVAQVVQHISEHAERILSVRELAVACNMSERTLFRKVDSALGVTPYELMLRIRIQKAAAALVQTTESVSAIALSHGFCYQSTFTQHFRKRIGMTPRQFRLRHTLR
ncbi:MAG: AraC family transcriptional regulator [Armatimonas sp.]